FVGRGLVLRDEVGDTVGDGARFARARSGQDQDRAVARYYCLTLGGIEIVELERCHRDGVQGCEFYPFEQDNGFSTRRANVSSVHRAAPTARMLESLKKWRPTLRATGSTARPASAGFLHAPPSSSRS